MAKKLTLKAQNSMIEVYMSIFNVTREDAIAALQARGMLPTNDKKGEESNVQETEAGEG
jgi:hypothetical protein